MEAQIIRLLAVLTAACLLLTGCTAKPRYHYDVRQDLGIYFTNADAVIEAIRNGLRRRDRQITISYSSHQDNLDELGTIVRELMECALDETDSPEEGDYIRYQYGGYTMHSAYHTDSGIYYYEITILPQYYTTAAEEERVTQRVEEILSALGNGAGMTELERVQAVTEYLREHVRYDEVHAGNENHHRKTTAYAALIQGQAVCQGYAAAVYRLLREMGVPVRIVTGMAGEEQTLHAWNLVCVDGLYYNLDLTWDDRNGDYACFMKSDADFPSHTRDAAFATAAFYEAYPMAQESISDLKGETHEEADDH